MIYQRLDKTINTRNLSFYLFICNTSEGITKKLIFGIQLTVSLNKMSKVLGHFNVPREQF